MYNGFTPTPTNTERVAYDAMREQEFLAMQLAAEQQRVNSTHYFDGLAKIEAEIVAIRTAEVGGTVTDLSASLHDAGFGDAGPM